MTPATAPTSPDHGDRLTQPGAADVDAHLAGVAPSGRREDAQAVLAMMREVTGAEPVMWGGSIVGFGRQPYSTADGKHHEWFALGLAPRKAALTLYGLTQDGSRAELLGRLGKHTTGKGCVNVKRLSDVDTGVLRELIATAWADNHTPA